MVAVEFFFTFLKAKMRSQNAGLGLKGSNYGASSSDSYKDKLKKLVCYSVAGHFAPCRARPFQSLRFELGKGETILVLLKKTRHKKAIRWTILHNEFRLFFTQPNSSWQIPIAKVTKTGTDSKTKLILYGFLVSKETVVLRRSESETKIWFYQTSW